MDVWRHLSGHFLPRRLDENRVASGASAERAPARVDRKAAQYLPKLLAHALRPKIDGVRRRSEPLVARQHDSPLAPRRAKQLRAAKLRIEANIHAAQPEPSRKPREHPIRRKPGSAAVLFQFPILIIAPRRRLPALPPMA